MFGSVTESGNGQSVPPGIYQGAIFTGAEPVPANVEKGYKPGFRFSFRIAEGPHAGAIASRIPGGEKPTTKNGLGKFLSEMTSIPLTAGATFDEAFQAAIGKPYTIVVKQGPGGGTRVETAMPMKYTNAEPVLPVRGKYTRCVNRLKLSHLAERTIPPGLERKRSWER